MEMSNPSREGSLAAGNKHKNPGLDLIGQGIVRAPRSLYRDAVRRFTRNKLAVMGLGIVVVLVTLAVFADDWFIALPLGREPAPLIARTPYDKVFFGPSGAFPGREFWMGTDLSGRDLFSRIVFGAHVSR